MRALTPRTSARTALLGWGLAALLGGCDDDGTAQPTPPDPDQGVTADAAPTPDAAAPDAAPAPQGPTWRVVAGQVADGHQDGPAEAARFDGMVCVALDLAKARLVISDAFSGTVRAVALADGATTTIAGRPYEQAVLDGPLSEARFANPRGCAVGPDGAVWIADDGALRRIDEAAGEVQTLAGLAGQPGSADGEDARLGYLIHHLAAGADGAVWIVDRTNDRLRRFDPTTGAISTVVGGGFGATPDGVAPQLDGPGGVAWWGDDLLLADTFAGRLWRVDPTSGDVLLEAEGLPAPQGVTAAGDVAYLAGFDGAVYAVDLLTGGVSVAHGRPGDAVAVDGLAEDARLGGAFAPLVAHPDEPWIYYADIDARSVRLIHREDGSVRPLAGPTGTGQSRDGGGRGARLWFATDVVGDGERWYVAEPLTRKVRRYDGRSVLTLIGADGRAGDQDGPLDQARMRAPTGLALDAAGQVLFVSDPEAAVVRAVDLQAGEVTTLAGSPGQAGDADGTGAEARFRSPTGLDWTPDGRLCVADGGAVRAVDPATGAVSTLTQGPFQAADVLCDADGTVWIADADAAVVWRATAGEAPAVAAGVPGETGPGDGPEGRLAAPVGLARGPDGLVLVVDRDNHRVRTLDPATGALGTWLGHPVRRNGIGHRDPVAEPDMTLREPQALSVDPGGQSVLLMGDALLQRQPAP